MAVSVQSSTWHSVIDITEVAQRKGMDPLLWALHLSSSLSSAGVALPSVELADVLVSYICWDNNVPILWKFLEKALMLNIVPPLLLLAQLSTRLVGLFVSVLCFAACLKWSFFFGGFFWVEMGYSFVGIRESWWICLNIIVFFLFLNV